MVSDLAPSLGVVAIALAVIWLCRPTVRQIPGLEGYFMAYKEVRGQQRRIWYENPDGTLAAYRYLERRPFDLSLQRMYLMNGGSVPFGTIGKKVPEDQRERLKQEFVNIRLRVRSEALWLS